MRFYFAAMLFWLLPACRGCAVRDQYELAVNEDGHRRVQQAEKEFQERSKAAAQAERDSVESFMQMHEAMEPRFIERSGYRTSPDKTCDLATEDCTAVERIHSTVGPGGKRLIFPPDAVAELVIPSGALDHTIEITVVMLKSDEPDHLLDYAVMPLGIELKKPAKLLLPASKNGPAKHRFMPVGHGEYQDTSSLYEPANHREVITLNRL